MLILAVDAYECFILQIQESIETGAYEFIPVEQPINLMEILGDKFPADTIRDLQGRVDQIRS